MSVVVFVVCDAGQCVQRHLGGTDTLPVEWGTVPIANPDPYAASPASLHYCPTHRDGPEHLAAMREARS